MGQAMMGRLKSEQAQLFYEIQLGDAVPKIIWSERSMLLSICPGFTASSHSLFINGAPVDHPELMIRMLIVGTSLRSVRND
jgi:hypothetical protein